MGYGKRGRPPKIELAPDVMTVEECAKFLRCGQRTVRQLIYDKKLPAYKAGGWRISKQALLDLMAQTA